MPWLRRLVFVIAFTAACFVQPRRGMAQQDESFSVVEATIADIHAAIQTNQLTCEQLVQIYLKRIQSYDQPTKLNAIVVANSRALERARQLDQQFEQTGKLLPLHGIPVVVKDNYDTRDLQTAAGSLALKGSIPPDDAFQIRKLREAGAIVLCKSNMAEWAYSPWFTISSIAGTTRNPYDLGRVPAGSSGGTAAAVAANFGTVGLGTDTGNSIRGPSAHCCLVGIRPTLGLTSRDGIVPLFLRNDVGGPMCRTVEDTARVLEVIAGHDAADDVTRLCLDHPIGSYVAGLDQDSLRGARIGVFRTLSNQKTADKQFLDLFEQAIEDLRRHGAEIVDPFDLAEIDYPALMQLQNVLWHDTFRFDIEAYLRSLGDRAPVSTIEDILVSGRFHESVAGRLRSSRTRRPPNLERPFSADPNDDPQRAALRDAVVAAMDAHGIDAFIYPTWNNPPRKLGDLKSPDGNNSFHIPPHTGQPGVTVPMGFNRDGLPAGLQMVGRPFSEARLLSLAYAYEQATRHRRPPSKFPELSR